VKRLKEFNISLMGKWVWRVLEERKSLWSLVLRAKYGEEGAVCRGGWVDLVATSNPNPSGCRIGGRFMVGS